MLLTKMLRDDDNKYCVDCDAKGPRWASWNLGVFLCIRCAGIHRNLGVHISRVKSVNLDTWTPEQVVSLEQMGNSRARAVYEALLPDGFRRPQTDSALESFVRAKYEQKKYLAREWVPPPPPKVDWDKEIDEEIERQKRKKKASSASGNISIAATGGSSTSGTSGNSGISTTVPLPKLKAPVSSTKASSRNTSETVTTAVAATSSGSSQANSDLLGLSLGGETTSKKLNGDSGDALDILSSGSNQPAQQTSSANEFSSLAKEEADFFNQAPNKNNDAQGKLTKDKIMALYGSAPTGMVNNNFNANLGAFGSFNSYQPANAFAQSVPVVPGAAHHYQMTNGQPNVTAPTPGGFGAFQTFPANGQFMIPGAPATNPQAATLMYSNGPFQPTTQPQPAFGAIQFPNPLQNQQPQNVTGFVGVTPATNATFANFPPQAQTQPEKLSNQFGNMNLRDVWQ